MKPLTWCVTDRRTGRLLAQFTGPETRPAAIKTAITMGHDVWACDVRAEMPDPEYLAPRDASDREHQRRRFLHKRGRHA